MFRVSSSRTPRIRDTSASNMEHMFSSISYLQSEDTEQHLSPEATDGGEVSGEVLGDRSDSRLVDLSDLHLQLHVARRSLRFCMVPFSLLMIDSPYEVMDPEEKRPVDPEE
ncbi:hypothetical protein EYF80_018593 [Liparis tanakae]|uniref:Uncharacterized protein n=1 Tax=Liparis tanakae TaxID=230148 RepID=A0A4Z2I0Z4_9TELE|nr:hypothetical protein EYF80_018593 [Liparis tanakae]